MQTPEGKVKAKIDKLLKTYEPRLYRFKPVQSGFGTKTLDYLCCFYGEFFAVEAKAPGKTMTEYQLATTSEITAAGGLVFVVCDDVTLQHLENYLDKEQQDNGYRRTV